MSIFLWHAYNYSPVKMLTPAPLTTIILFPFIAPRNQPASQPTMSGKASGLRRRIPPFGL